ncbi:MAG: hypothetical protein HY700_11195 [Gemmatimonadetes bacterium]|nr:hypothetical protein [Gemmatimonadota bacterium]
MHTPLLAGVLLLGVAACARTTRESQTETVTTVRETVTSPALAAQPPVRVAGTLESGTKLSVLLRDSITSLKTHPGDIVPAVINQDVKDGNGYVIFPAGTLVEVQVTAIQPASANQDDARILLGIKSAKVGDHTYFVGQSANAPAEVKDGGIDKSKVAVGAAAGAAVGGLIAGSVKAAVVGGLVGGAAGAAVGHETARRDLVVTPGTKVDFTLEQPVVLLTS